MIAVPPRALRLFAAGAGSHRETAFRGKRSSSWQGLQQARSSLWNACCNNFGLKFSRSPSLVTIGTLEEALVPGPLHFAAGDGQGPVGTHLILCPPWKSARRSIHDGCQLGLVAGPLPEPSLTEVHK